MRLGARRHSYASMNVSMRFSFAELDALMKAVCSLWTGPVPTVQYCRPSAAPTSPYIRSAQTVQTLQIATLSPSTPYLHPTLPPYTR
jgi:hypothetical protein